MRIAETAYPLPDGRVLTIRSAEPKDAASLALHRCITSYYIKVVFIDRSPAECYNKFRMLWIGMYHLPQRRFSRGSNHSFFVEMLIS